MRLVYALTYENKPKRVVVTEISEDRIRRAKEVISPEEAKEHGIELIYANTATMKDPVQELMDLTDGKGYDDVFVYIPNKSVCEMGNKIMAYDGCMNLFAGPTDPKFSAEINLYDSHYSRSKVLGSTGGTIDDMKEAIAKAAQGKIKPAVMITHIGGLDSVVDTTKNLPDIAGGKKLIYTQIDMPLTAIEDFANLAKEDERFAKLHEICAKNNNLWCAEAEKVLIENFA